MEVKKYAVILLVLAGVLCMGMGGSTDIPPGKLPTPDRQFRVILIDQDDVSHRLDKFSVEGKTFVNVSIGKATVGIDFAEIKKGSFFMKNEKIIVRLKLRNGEEKETVISPKVQFFGLTSIGVLRIHASDVKEIEFQ